MVHEIKGTPLGAYELISELGSGGMGTVHLARAVEGRRILVVAMARPGVAEDELAHFSRLENYRRVVLGRLGGREIIALLEDAFKSEALAENESPLQPLGAHRRPDPPRGSPPPAPKQ